jgi:ribonucleotide reductase beta subunit family protein with ferritin-like domain
MGVYNMGFAFLSYSNTSVLTTVISNVDFLEALAFFSSFSSFLVLSTSQAVKRASLTRDPNWVEVD